MFEENTLKNINTADTFTLADLPGIGPSIAERIVENRPFTAIDELLNVKGIGSQTLEKFRDFITVEEPSNDNEVVAEEESLIQLDSPKEAPTKEEVSPREKIVPFDIFDEDSTDEVIVEIEEGIIEKEATAKKHDNLVTRPQAWWLAFSSVLLAFILALALTFGILMGINGGLHYTSQRQTATIERQLTVLSTQIDTLSQDIEGLRERVDNLDHLGNRVDKLEDRLNTSEGKIENLSYQLNELQENSGRFQTFLEDLHQLLNSLFQSEEYQ